MNGPDGMGTAANPLACRPLPGLLFSLALPAMLSQLITLGYNMIDRIYLGHTREGVAAIAAAGVCVPVLTIILAMVCLFGRGGAPLSSIRLGAGKREEAERILGASLFWLICCACFCTLVILAWAEPLLAMFGAGDDILGPAAMYLRIYSLGNIFMMAGLGLNFFINAQGFTRIGMVTPLIGCAANIALDPIFIFQLEMGVAGAAVATVIAQFLSLLWVARFYRSKKCLLHVRPGFIRPAGQLDAEIMLLGSAPAFMVGTEGLLLLCFNLRVSCFGGQDAIGVMAILSSLFQLLLLPMIGIYQGAQPVVGFNYGAGNLERAKRAIILTGVALCLYSALATGVMAAFPQVFTGLFTDSKELIRESAPLLGTYISGGFFLGITVVSQDTYNALGDGRLALFFALFRKGVLLVPLIFLLPEFYADKLQAVMMAECISDAAASFCSGIYFLLYMRKKFAPRATGAGK